MRWIASTSESSLEASDIYKASKLRCLMVNYALAVMLSSEAQSKSYVVVEGQGHK